MEPKVEHDPFWITDNEKEGKPHKMQTKIFSESNESLLENEINAWLRRYKKTIDVTNIKFSSSVSTCQLEDDYGRGTYTDHLYSAMIIYKDGE